MDDLRVPKAKRKVTSGCMLDDQRIRVLFPIETEIILFSTAFKPNVKPSQYLIQ